MRRKPREQDLEKQYRTEFQRYEDWKASQVEGGTEEKKPLTTVAETKEPPKKFGLSKLEWIFVLLGALFAMIYRGCIAN
jgi:hypothetical protein